MESPLFELYRGDDHGLQLTIKDDLDQPVDITGWVFKASLRLNPYTDSGEAGVSVSTGALAGTNATNGIVEILLPHAQTENLVPGSYFFDIQREAYDTVKTVLSGRVLVKVDVTRGQG